MTNRETLLKDVLSQKPGQPGTKEHLEPPDLPEWASASERAELTARVLDYGEDEIVFGGATRLNGECIRGLAKPSIAAHDHARSAAIGDFGREGWKP